MLVTHDGIATLRRTVAALVAQTDVDLELVAVDNASTDGTTGLLVELLGPERVIVADRDLGLPGGVDLALDAVDARDALHGRTTPPDDDLVLIVHDDLELAPDAVSRLVAALADERVGIVGPKLRWAHDRRRLQSVGATIDLTGRVDDGLDPDELDQGQRDGDRQVLFVSTAGMLVRRRVLDALGRFDPRARAFREDLDLCWSATVAGHDVVVVPSAVGWHAALAAEHRRPVGAGGVGARELAERNTLTALLTNYGPERLLAVVPLALVVGVAKVAGFLLTRRIADARATVAAWGWTLTHLRGTLRRRRRVQRARRRSDREIALRLGRVTPRLQAYLEAVLDRLFGDPVSDDLGSAESDPSATLQGELVGPSPDGRTDGGRTDVDRERPPAPAPDAPPAGVSLRQRLVTRPAQVLVPPVVVLLLVGLRDLLLPGVVRGGQLLPFPAGDGLLTRHLAGWHDSGATLSALDPSPSQLVLGVLQWAGGDAALRVLLLAAPLLAWALAVRALAPHLPAVLPRVVLGLAYALSPPALAALTTGDLTTVVVLLALPALAVTANTILSADAAVERVWRRIGVSAVLLAVLVAFVPLLVLALPVLLLAGVGHAVVAVDDPAWRRTLIARSVVVTLLPLPLLGPWLLSLPAVLADALGPAGPTLGGHPLRWLALDPTGRLLGAAGAGLVLAGIAGSLVVAVASASRTVRRAALALLVVGLTAPLLAWWFDAVGSAVAPGPLLLLATAAHVAVAGRGAADAPAVLARHGFGWRQVGVAGASTATAGLLVVGLLGLAVTGTPGLSRTDTVPAYLATLGSVPPDRLLVIGATEDGVVWEVVPASGPDLAAFGVRHDPRTAAALADAVDDLLDGRDPRAADRLGRLGVGVVLVPEEHVDPLLRARLRAQSALDPLPSLDGLVARVRGAVPGAAIATARVSTDRVPDPGVAPRELAAPLARTSAERFTGDSGPGGDLVATVPFGAGWQVRVDGAAVPVLSDDGLVRALDVPASARVDVVATAAPGRRTGLRLQALWAVLVLSLAARPPALARRDAARRQGAR